jgi:hypothetical protein
MNQATVRLKPCDSTGKTNSKARKINRQIWRKQRVFAVWKGGWIATVLFLAVSAHASEPRYFHLRVARPTYARIVRALHQLESGKVVRQ